MSLSQAERDLLAILQEDDEPLAFVCSGAEQQRRLQAASLSLLRQGLIEVYGSGVVGTPLSTEESAAYFARLRELVREGSTPSYEPEPALPPTEAENVLRSVENWTTLPSRPLWFVRTSREGDALLVDDS